ncbi:uncharacterized protein [Paramisgurnus dabryanus]|uniref:uncharacterized protein isoform X1 n=1 Tax=Paramisgurnus dabryanus TaxID=90735 RepID=UPI003CCFBA3E
MLFCYNTTPHQTTGESPYFLMFGQEPRLPIDFLLGGGQEMGHGSINEWVLEHQTRLQVAFEGAREHVKAAADRRKAHHDLHVRDTPLGEGQLVYLRNYGVRGRHKIQDLWSPVVYQVVKAPKVGGSVYTIAPVDDLNKVKHVHRSLLKIRVQGESPVLPSDRAPEVVEAPPLEESTFAEEVDLWVSVPEVQPMSDRRIVQGPVLGVPSVSSECVGHSEGVVPVSSELPGVMPVTEPVVVDPLLESQSSAGDAMVRHTGRVNAGQHSNRYHLPRAAGELVREGTRGPMSNSVSALFRPWH